jgi:RHS repeat-associated protein
MLSPARLSHGLAIGIVLCLLTSSTPAAPQTIVALANESLFSFHFWFYNSGARKLLLQGQRGGAAKKQEKQSDRDAKISQIQIFPGNLTVDADDKVKFSAIALDAIGNPIGGTKIKWTAHGAASDKHVPISPRGDFDAARAGTFTVTAETRGITAQVTVVVRPGLKRDLSLPPTNVLPVSSRGVRSVKVGANQTEKPNKEIAKATKRAHAAKSATPAALLPEGGGGGWDDSNYWSAGDPENRVGDPPGVSADGGAGSGNFQFAAPVLSLPGRGINISLGLAYNSRLWNKAGTQMSYDNDRGWPAPGFSLGFGRILGMGVYNGAMLVDADGTRHGYTGSIQFYNWGTHFVGHTTDGSFIDYSYWTGTGGVMTSAQAQLPNGTIINYGATGPGGVYPTSIEDSNGNFIVITYVNNSGPNIQTIQDTLGRTVNFYYDANNLLTAINASGLSGNSRTLVRLHYHQMGLSYAFNGLSTSVRNSSPWVIDAIYYPATATGYWLNDSDSYSSYGMLAKVVEERGMGFSASSVYDMGSVWQGSVTRSETYNYSLYPDYSLTDAPTYTSMTESWSRDGTIFDNATTQFEVHENDSPRTTTITLPNGTKNTQLAYNHPGQYDDGVVYHDETFVTPGQVLQSSTSYWQAGDYGSPRPYRIEKIDELGQLTAAEFSYGSYNQVTEARDYDYGGALLRATRTTYQNSTAYTGTAYSTGYVGRHIFNLPLSIEVFASNYSTRVSHKDYQYDGQTLTDTPNVVMHDDASNPYTPQHEQCDCYQWDYWQIECLQWNCYQVSDYRPATDARGNVTQETSYSDGYNLGGPIAETRRYDITGNVVTVSTSCCEQASFAYSNNTQYAYPESKTLGSASDPYAQVTASAIYDFYTGLGQAVTDANGRTSTTNYDTATQRPINTNSPTGAYTDFGYDDTAMTITATTHAATGEGGGIADQNLKYLNGRGQVRHEQALSPNSSWDHVDIFYDSMGQVVQQTRPYHSGDSTQLSTTEYDALGRVKTVTAPDSSVTRSFYNESSRPDVASSVPGETARVQDAWGRERWGRTDSSGRLVEVVEPNPNGNGTVATAGLLTTYAYNTLGNLITINSVTNGSVEQTRSFAYDSLGRLTAQKLAEASATLDIGGAYHSTGGTWSDVFTYDERSNLTSRTDARGVKTVYSHNSDPLNRLQSVSWDTSGLGDPNPVLPAATVTYQYRTKTNPSDAKDVTQLASITTNGVSSESYGYDGEGRVSSKTLTLNTRSSFPFATSYIYDTLDRISDVIYPAEYGNGSQARKIIHHDYDIASRITALSFDGQTFASNIAYNAASQTTSLTVGTGTNAVNESYNYNSQTGLLDSQALTRNGSTLLSLSYDYTNASGKRTGQLTKISNNLNHGKDRSYSYDALGRLVQATGGPSGSFWSESYVYDRYGNRTSVSASGHTARLEKPAEPKPNLPTDLIAKNTAIELPTSLRDKDNSAISDSTTPLFRPSSASSSSASSKAAVPVMPQSGSKVAFASTRDGNSQIYLMNTDGSAQTRITNNQTNDEAPRWSSNSRIVFQSDRDNPFCDLYDIYAMNSDGSGQTRLTSDPNDDRAPVWSPDGSKIAFQSLRNGTNYQVYVMNADGSGQTNISNSGANDIQPSWSPDGTKIAFASDRDHSGYPSVYVMNSNGASQTRLTFDNAPYGDNQPSWSPDGSRIAFTSTRDSTIEYWTETDDYEIPDDDGQTFPRSRVNVNKEIYVMFGGGSGQTRLTSTPENDESPYWSGDGSKIIFRSDRERDDSDPIPQVWSMNAEGSAQTNLSNNQSPDYSPSCQYSIAGGSPPTCLTIDQFIKNFYQGALARQPNQNEFQSWSSQLRAAYYQGHLLAAVQYMGRELFKSPEYVNRGRDDHSYVYDLYWAYLQRQPDQGGWDWWTGQVASSGRDNVRIAFELDTTEFAPKVAALCIGSSGSSGISTDGLASQTYENATNRVTTPGFAYDVAGNQTRIIRADGSGQRFQYDAANRLIQVRDDYGYVLETFTYGSSNERLIADQIGYRTYFDCEGGSTIAEYSEGGGSTTPVWSKSYVYLGGRLLSTLTPSGGGGGAIQYHHPDRLGTRIVTDPSNGNFFEQQTLPFGSALDEAPPAGGTSGATNRRFTTYDRSAATGLDYANNRHYDSQQGRFTQVDPAGMSTATITNPQTLNLYAYCANDPINRVDPSGLGFLSFLGKALNVISKILKIVAVIVAVVLIVAAVSLMGTPGMGVLVAKALISAGLLLTNAFAPPKIAAAAGILVGIFTMKPPIIFNLAEKAGHGGLARLLGILRGVSSVNDYLQDDDPKPPDEPLDVIIINHSERKSIGQRILGGITKALITAYVAQKYVEYQSDRFSKWALRRMAENSKLAQIGTYPNGQPIYFGGGAAGTVNVFSGELSEAAALANAEQWLGAGYTELAPGVYRSADNLRQFRMTTSDILDPAQGPHVHFESIAPDGRTILENGHVKVKP